MHPLPTAIVDAAHSRGFAVTIFNKDMIQLTTKNELWRKEVYRGVKSKSF
jgi:hypothetical protein